MRPAVVSLNPDPALTLETPLAPEPPPSPELASPPVPSLGALARRALQTPRDRFRVGAMLAFGVLPITGSLWKHGWLARASAHIATGKPGLPPLTLAEDLRSALRCAVAYTSSAMVLGPFVGYAMLRIWGLIHFGYLYVDGQLPFLVASAPEALAPVAWFGLSAALRLITLVAEAFCVVPLLATAMETLRWVSRGELVPFLRMKEGMDAWTARPVAFASHSRVLYGLCLFVMFPWYCGFSHSVALLAWTLVASQIALVVAVLSTARWDSVVRQWEAEEAEKAAEADRPNAEVPATAQVR